MVNGKIFCVIVNEKYIFDEIKGELDIIFIVDGYFYIIQDNLFYNVEVLGMNYNEKVFELKINGVIYEVKFEDEYDQLVK